MQTIEFIVFPNNVLPHFASDLTPPTFQGYNVQDMIALAITCEVTAPISFAISS